MKKALSLILSISLLFAVACNKGNNEQSSTAKGSTSASATKSSSDDFHIGIATGTVSQSEDDLRGAEALIKEYGSVANGGMIQHVTYPDNFMEEQETTIAVIAGMADDPKMKAIIVNQAIPGTTEAFRQIKEKRPDIICIAGESHEDIPQISKTADLVANNDFVARGYLIIRTAHELGCDTFVHISFPRHMSYETLSRRAAIMKAACEDFGMKFVQETAPDPTSDVGVAGAQQYILEKVPAWINQYGQKSAFFCTNDAHTEPLLKQLITYGGYFIEADLPSPLMGYPGALGLDLSKEAGDFTAILKKVESALVERGAANRFGTWAYSYGYTQSAALGQHAINVIRGESKLTEMKDLQKAYDKYTPGARWNGAFYTNANTGAKTRNVILVYQDTYIMGGKGYMGNADVVVPEKYFTTK